MSRSFGICPKCGTDTFDDVPCSNGCEDVKPTVKSTIRKHGQWWRIKKGFLKRHIPHKTASGNQWCLPVFWAKIFGGTWDTGNGYAWHPAIWKRESFRFGSIRVTKIKPLFGERNGYEKVFRIGKWRFDSLKSNTEISGCEPTDNDKH